jgi:hypothetical protein
VLFIIIGATSSKGIPQTKVTPDPADIHTISPTHSAKDGDCIGPDGKRIHLSTKACEEFNNAWKHPPNQQAQQQEIPPTITPTKEHVTEQSADSDLQDLFTQMDIGGDGGTAYVSTEYGHIQAIRQNSWPDAFVDFGVKTMTFEFIRNIYLSKYPIQQAGMTINGPTGKYYRAFLGRTQAQALNAEDWKSYTPTPFYTWMKSVQTNINEPRENRTVIEEKL